MSEETVRCSGDANVSFGVICRHSEISKPSLLRMTSPTPARASSAPSCFVAMPWVGETVRSNYCSEEDYDRWVNPSAPENAMEMM